MKTMKKMMTLLAVAGLVLALAPAAQAANLIDYTEADENTQNNGSFEGATVDAQDTLTGWTLDEGSLNSGFYDDDDWGYGPASRTPKGHGTVAFEANTTEPISITSDDISQVVQNGDVFTWEIWTAARSFNPDPYF